MFVQYRSSTEMYVARRDAMERDDASWMQRKSTAQEQARADGLLGSRPFFQFTDLREVFDGLPSRRRRPHTSGPCSLDAPWHSAPSIRGVSNAHFRPSPANPLPATPCERCSPAQLAHRVDLRVVGWRKKSSSPRSRSAGRRPGQTCSASLKGRTPRVTTPAQDRVHELLVDRQR